MISCFEFGWMNPHWAYAIDKEGNPNPIFPERIFSRSQDLPKLFCPSGAIWITTQSMLLKHKNFYCDEYKLKELPWKEAIDIDSQFDLEMAQVLLEARNNNIN